MIRSVMVGMYICRLYDICVVFKDFAVFVYFQNQVYFKTCALSHRYTDSCPVVL